MSKKLFFIVAAVSLCFCGVSRGAYNPFFGDAKNQVAFGLGQGFDDGFLVGLPVKIVPYYSFHSAYSQPTTFFRVPARQSINIDMNIGMGNARGWEWDNYSIPIIYLSEDVPLIYSHNWAVGTGVGMGFQGKQNNRLGSKLLFGFKLFGRYNINKTTGIELYMQHFSNGNTAENHSYLFYGLGLTYNF
ncbi:MAG: acyloxyacyl hydrolase [Rickettsiales bacterium]|jgi:hypothetical protein|nr:acyloxyacyl hydrolase [Rickettsiales bacterium]